MIGYVLFKKKVSAYLLWEKIIIKYKNAEKIYKDYCKLIYRSLFILWFLVRL